MPTERPTPGLEQIVESLGLQHRERQAWDGPKTGACLTCGQRFPCQTALVLAALKEAHRKLNACDPLDASHVRYLDLELRLEAARKGLEVLSIVMDETPMRDIRRWAAAALKASEEPR